MLALAAAAPLSAFAAVDADAGEAAPAAVVQELAPTVAYAGTVSAPFARNTPAVVQRTDGGSDHPQLLARDRHVYLSWRTQAEGYRLIDVTDAVPLNAALEAAP
ncbi:hypothetical protein [Ralstonia pseudosolanacearum]